MQLIAVCLNACKKEEMYDIREHEINDTQINKICQTTLNNRCENAAFICILTSNHIK